MPKNFDRKAYSLELLGKLLSSLPAEARILLDNLPYCAVVGWPFVRDDGSPGMQSRTWLWPGAFAFALEADSHELIVIEQQRESPEGLVTTIETTGGELDPGTEPLQQAKEELWEEAGAQATEEAEWIPIGLPEGFNPLDGVAWTNQYAFLCTSAKLGGSTEKGIRRVATYPLSQIIKMDNANAFKDPYTPYIVRRLRDWLEANRPELLT